MCRLTALALAIAIPLCASYGSAQDMPRMADGRPDLRGVWQALNTANWNIQNHPAELGVPAGQGVVEGDELPYLPDSLAQRRENHANRLTDDPEAKCFMAGVPRITVSGAPTPSGFQREIGVKTQGSS